MPPLSPEQRAYIERVVDRYSDTLLRIAAHNCRTQSDAQDAVQTVFLKLIHTAPTFQSEEHEKAWLIRVTVNHCRDVLRSGWSRRTVPLPETEDPGTHDETDTESLAVLQAVRSLPEKYRAPVYLHYYEGYTTAEIAAMLGVRRGTIDSRLFRARQKLEALLKGGWD